MTPLPTIEAAQAKTPRNAARTDVSKTGEVPGADDESSFAATLAANVDSPKVTMSGEIQRQDSASVEDGAVPEVNTPELVIGAVSGAVDRRNSNAALPKVPRAVQMEDADQVSPDKRLTRSSSEDAGRAAKAEGPAKLQATSLAQRVVEVRMPGKSAVQLSQSTATMMSQEDGKTTAAPPDLLQAKRGAPNPATEIKSSELLTSKPVTQVIKKADFSNVGAPPTVTAKSDKVIADPAAPRVVLSEAETNIARPPRAKVAAVQATTIAVQPPLVALSAHDLQKLPAGLASGDAELTQTLLVGDRPSAPTTFQPVATSPTHGAETARHVAQQLAAGAAQHSGKVTEIALNPEELGRVRMAMTSVDAAITLSVSAERPETMDLLRRHIDVLAQEFRDLGYDNINFSFGGDGPADQEEHANAPASHGDTGEAIELTMQPEIGPVVGLDLRL